MGLTRRDEVAVDRSSGFRDHRTGGAGGDPPRAPRSMLFHQPIRSRSLARSNGIWTLIIFLENATFQRAWWRGSRDVGAARSILSSSKRERKSAWQDMFLFNRIS